MDEYGDDDDEYCEEDVDWHTGDCDDELEESAHTVDLRQMRSLVYQQVAVHEARELLSRVTRDRGYFPVVGSGAFDGLAQPSTDRKPAQSRGKGKKGKRKGNTSSHKGGTFQTLVHLESCQNHRPHVQSFAHRRPRSVRLKLAQLVVDNIALLGFVLISACCVAKFDILHQDVPTKEKRLPFHMANVHLVHTL